MLFKVEMTVRLPADMPAAQQDEIKRIERDYAQKLQDSGQWRHLWRVAGQYANVSIFDVSSVEELHQLLTGLPLFPYMSMGVVPLCRHPSSIRESDR
jgi:muconolactone D-isomerase